MRAYLDRIFTNSVKIARNFLYWSMKKAVQKVGLTSFEQPFYFFTAASTAYLTLLRLLQSTLRHAFSR